MKSIEGQPCVCKGESYIIYLYIFLRGVGVFKMLIINKIYTCIITLVNYFDVEQRWTTLCLKINDVGFKMLFDVHDILLNNASLNYLSL